jgi:diguanylate cyclase (GGDEF)-like protein
VVAFAGSKEDAGLKMGTKELELLFLARRRLAEGDFTPEDRMLLDELLALVSQQARELEALKRISLNLTGSLDLEQVLNGVVREAIRLVKRSRYAHIFLYQQNELKFGTSIAADGTFNKEWIAPRPEGLTYTVARTAGPIVVEDMRSHPLYAGTPPDWEGSIVGIPLKMESQVVGVMNLSRSITGAFSHEELRLLQLLADQAAIAILNARLHEAVTRQARTDILTGLPNRRALDEKLDDEFQRAQRFSHSFAIVMMDLDGFKAINDTFGHEVGDMVLRETFGLLGRSLRATDFIARYGGDELTIVLPEANQDQAIEVSRKLQMALRAFPVLMPDGTRKIFGLSAGIAVYPLHATTSADLLRAADTALYRAKRARRGISVLAYDGPTRPRNQF